MRSWRRLLRSPSVFLLAGLACLGLPGSAFAAYPPQIPPPDPSRLHIVRGTTPRSANVIFSNMHNYGPISIRVDVLDNYLGDFTKYQWVYTVHNFGFNSVPGTSNGFSGFELALPTSVPDIANITAPDGIPPWIINSYSGQPVEWDLPNFADTVGGGTMPGQTEVYSFTTLPRLITSSTGWYHTWMFNGQTDITYYPAGDGPEVPDLIAAPNQELCCTHDALGIYSCQALPAGQCAAVGGTIVSTCNSCPPVTKTEKRSWGKVKNIYR
jgi:hypothetical protein